MTPERWQLLERIFHAAVELPEDQRQQFLDQQCGSDVELRKDIEALLAKDDSGVSKAPITSIIARQAASLSDSAEEDLTGKSLGPYSIVRRIGSGGMGTVYLAQDTRLQRDVALKILPEALCCNPDRERRFQLEARAASAINHPNVITIHHVEKSGGLNFIVCEYVAGQTLADKIDGKPLRIVEVLQIAIQIADGLAEAHRLGFVHRDIKPRNVMVTERGTVKILDFGLAKRFDSVPHSTRDDPDKTATGVVVGTVQYMSPEQAKAQVLDARTDLFSFGLVVYEMATGRQAFSGESDAVIFEAILNKEPISACTLNSKIPPELERIINKALKKHRDDRYQSAIEMMADLKRLLRQIESAGSTVDIRVPLFRSSWFTKKRLIRAAITLFVLAVAVGFAILYTGRNRDHTIRSLAVLPFVNSSGNSDVDYLSDGITDTTINTLSQLGDLKVMARGSVFTFKGRNVDPREAGRKLNVDAVVTGRVLQQGDTLIIRAELMNVRDGTQLWGGEYNRKLSDIMQTQREIAQEISRNLSRKLTGEDEKRIGKIHTTNTEAYRLCLLGEYYAHKENQESLKKSVEYYQQAIQLDPNYAIAYSGLANSYIYFPSISLASFREVASKTLEAATRAIALDNTLAQPHVALGGYYRNKGDFETAEKEYLLALELEPDYSEAYVYLAFVYSLLGRHEQAIQASSRALELDPLWASNYSFDGLVLTAAGKYDRAKTQLEKAKEMDSSFCVTYVNLGQLYREQGKLDEAIQALKAPEAQQTGCSGTWGMSELAYTYALAGKKDEAKKLLDQILKYSERQFVTTNYIAVVYLGLGDYEKALYWLEKGYKEESYWTGDMLLYLPVLRADPRFTDFLKRIRLA